MSPHRNSCWTALALAAAGASAATAQVLAPGPYPSAGPRDFSGAYFGPGPAGGQTAHHSCAPAFVSGIGGAVYPTHVVSGKYVVVIAQEENHELRRVYLDVEHPKDLKPTIYGHSIGRFEGDTLVVETIGLRSGQTVVERIRKVNGGRQLEVTVDGRVTRADWRPDLTWVEAICEGPDDQPGPRQPLIPTLAGAPLQPVEAPASGTAHPSFEGVWQIITPVTMLKAVGGRAPPLRPAAMKLYEQRLAMMKAGAAKSYDATYLCKPMGDPRTGYEGLPFDIVQSEREILVGYTWNRMARFVYLQDKHGEIAGPTYYGNWIGRWDGNSLVLDGLGFSESTLLDAAGMPHSGELHIVQRLTLKNDGNALEILTTFDDPKTFFRSWDAVNRYRKLPAVLIEEDICPQRLGLNSY